MRFHGWDGGRKEGRRGEPQDVARGGAVRFHARGECEGGRKGGREGRTLRSSSAMFSIWSFFSLRRTRVRL